MPEFNSLSCLKYNTLNKGVQKDEQELVKKIWGVASVKGDKIKKPWGPGKQPSIIFILFSSFPVSFIYYIFHNQTLDRKN